MFSCLSDDRFADVLLEGTGVSLVLDAATSVFDKTASGRLRNGVLGRACNVNTSNCHSIDVYTFM